MTPTEKPTGRSPLWMRWLLVGSLAVNLLVLGVAVGSFARHGPHGGGPNARQDMFYFGALPRGDRDDIIKSLRERRDEGRSHRSDLYKEAALTIELLRAETLDTEALAQSIQRQRGYVSQHRAFGDQAFVAHLSGMSLAERRAYADRLQERLTHRHHRRDR